MMFWFFASLILYFILIVLIVIIIRKSDFYTTKKGKMVCILLVLLLIVAPIFYYGSSYYYNFTVTILREYQTDTEYNAILVAEQDINYTSIFGIQRFDQRGVNYIDEQVIEHYSNLIYDNRRLFTSGTSKFCYVASAYSVNQSIVKYEDYFLTIKNEKNVSILSSHVSKSQLWPPQFAIFNRTDYYTIEFTNDINETLIDFQFNQTIIIEMRLSYNNYREPLARTYVQTGQIVIFNSNLEPLFILIKP